MQPQSAWDFLSALSAWIWPLTLDHLWHATAFVAVAAGVVWLLRQAPAQARFWVWMLATLKFLLPTAVLVSLFPALGIPTPEFAHGLLWIFQSDTAGPALQVVPQAWWGAVTAVWLAGVLFVSFRWLNRHRRLSRRIRAERVRNETIKAERTASRGTLAARAQAETTGPRRPDCGVDRTDPSRAGRKQADQRERDSVYAGREQDILERACRRMNLKRPVALLLADDFSGPGVWGLGQPVLVLPRHMAGQLDDAELESVFLHELAHVRRRDNLTAHLSMIVCCLLWFHPLVWFLNRRLLTEREAACDDLVLSHFEDSRSYANGLLKIVKLRMEKEVAGMAAASGAPLGNRLRRILTGAPALALTLRHRLALVAAGAVLLTLTAFSPAKAHCPYAQQLNLQEQQKADDATMDSEAPEDGLLL
ncbi:MAG TPA: M56 family metallopeptidase [Acidobacteriota bacterium]|nr:M56 family metallopeptidase [Acidobacteriota bacterium]